jgi:thymidylate synthase
MSNEYLQFIEECRNKDYTNLVTQIHHIIPKHMGGDNSNDNLVELSLDDHYIAHLMLSDCYDGKYKQKNIASAIYIKGYLDNLDKLEEYQKTLKGECNPNYGNSWTDEKRKVHSEKIKQMWDNPTNLKKIMKPKSDTSKMGKYDKRGQNNPFYAKTHTDETKQKLSELRKGIKPSNTNYIEIDGVVYYGLTDASTATGIKPTTIWYRIKSKNIKYSGYKSHPSIKAPLSN